MATFPVCYSVLSIWTIEQLQRHLPTYFITVVGEAGFFATDTHSRHGPANISADFSTINP